VLAMVDATGAAVASYEYDPFGKTLLKSGSSADANPFRFSTKYFDAELGLYYYGYRYYAPEMGAWLSRDPMEEAGGMNLYVFSRNNGINYSDVLGLRPIYDDPKTGLLTDMPPDYEQIVLRKEMKRASEQFYAEEKMRIRDLGWRIIFVLEQAGKYRELYSEEASKLDKLEGSVSKTKLIKLRGNLKTKYQVPWRTPPEAEAALRVAIGDKYDKRIPTGNYNPGKTNATINKAGYVCKYVGRVFIVLMVYSEYKKIHDANDWQRQLGASSSGFLGSIWGGECKWSHCWRRIKCKGIPSRGNSWWYYYRWYCWRNDGLLYGFWDL